MLERRWRQQAADRERVRRERRTGQREQVSAAQRWRSFFGVAAVVASVAFIVTAVVPALVDSRPMVLAGLLVCLGGWWVARTLDTGPEGTTE